MVERSEETKKKHRLVQHVYDVVAQGDDDITAALREAEKFLRKASAIESLEERRKLAEPPALEHPIFERIFPQLGRRNPLVALRESLKEEERRPRSQENQQKIPGGSTQHLAETGKVFVAPTGEIDSNIEKKPSKKNKKVVIPPWGFSSRAELVDRISGIPLKEINSILRATDREGKNGRIFYNTEDFLRSVARWKIEKTVKVAQQKAERPTRKRLDSAEWGTMNRLQHLTGLSKKVLTALLPGVPIEGGNGTRVRYNIPAVLEKVKETPERVDTETGLYTDASGEVWVPKSKVQGRLGISSSNKLIGEVSSLQVIGGNGRSASVYNEAELRLRLEQKNEASSKKQTKLPIAQVLFQAPTEIPVDTPQAPKPEIADRVVKDDVAYVSIGYLIRSGGVRSIHQTLHALLDDLSGIPGKSRNGKEITLFPETEAYQRINAWRAEQRTQKEQRKPRPKRPDPKIWTAEKDLATEYGLSSFIVHKVLAESETVTWGKGSALHYKGNKARREIERYLAQQPDDTGVAIIDGEQKAPLFYFFNRFGISYPTLREDLAQVTPTEGTKGFMLYSLSEAMEILDRRIKVPQVAMDSGFYTDSDQEQWGSVDVIVKRLGITQTKVATYLEDVATRDIRGRNGLLTKGYRLSEIERKAADYLSLPSEEQLIELGEAVIDAVSLAEEYNFPASSIRKFLEPIGIKVRGRSKQKRYPETQARERVESFLELPEIDMEGNQYVDEHGTIYLVKSEACKRLGVNDAYIKKAITLGDIGKITGRKVEKFGEEFTLYSLAELLTYKENPVHATRRTWTTAEIESAALSLFLEEGRITHEILNKVPGLKMAVTKHYPGSISKLRETIIQPAPKPSDS